MMETMIYYGVLLLLLTTFLFDLILSILNYKHRKSKIPIEVEDIYDLDAYDQWLNYTMDHYILSFISKIIHFVILFSLLIFNFFSQINYYIESLMNSKMIQILLFTGLYFVIEFILDLIFSYFRHFKIEEEYGFNKMTKHTFIIDNLKSLSLNVTLGGGLLYLLIVLYYHVSNLFYLYAWITLMLILIFVNLFYVKLIIPLFNKLTPLEDGELKMKIQAFAQTVGYEVTRIRVMNASKRTTKLNAFFSGFGRMKQVVLYDTLLEKMNHDQIISVLAHEIGHAKHKHIVKNIFFAIISISFYLGILILILNAPILHQAFGFEQIHFGFGLILFSILTSPISFCLDLLFNKISRTYEYQADAFATIHYDQNAMIEALKVLARENFANLTPHPLYVQIKYSHPPIAKRIQVIQAIK